MGEGSRVAGAFECDTPRGESNIVKGAKGPKHAEGFRKPLTETLAEMLATRVHDEMMMPVEVSSFLLLV